MFETIGIGGIYLFGQYLVLSATFDLFGGIYLFGQYFVLSATFDLFANKIDS